MEIFKKNIKELVSLIEKKKVKKEEVTESFLGRISETEKRLNAFITVVDKKDLSISGKEGPLSGIPIGVKDVLCSKGIKTTAASKMLENFIPPFDAASVAKLKNAGSIILGKNNCDAWAHGVSTENSDFGVTKNPWDLERVPGGSSGGSAAAVAANQIAFSLGSDTGGSIRQPASFCGVVGLKPTYGRVSRYGLIAIASSLDVVGPITKTVEDAALVMNVISGGDEMDATTSKKKAPDYLEKIDSSIKGKKVGIPKEYFGLGVDEETKRVYKETQKILENAGCEIVDISLPHTEYGVAVYYILQPAEVSSNLGRYDGIKYGFSSKESKNLKEHYLKTRDQGFGQEAKRRIMLGTFSLSSGYYDDYYLKAQKVRRLITQDFEKAFEKVDFILSPVAPTPAFKIGEKIDDPLSMYLADVYTAPSSLAGVPAISVPSGFSQKGLPIGMQILGPKFHEKEILNAAYVLEAGFGNKIKNKKVKI